MSSRRGLALIVVVGVLGVLAVLAVAFVTMAQLERRASQQRMNAAKAYLLARSGIEDALARLSLGQDPAYGGEDWDGSGGALSAFETAQEVYRQGSPDLAGCPVRHAMRPSFFERMPSGNPVTAGMDGLQRGRSGALSGDFSTAGNAYVLKVEERGGIHVNGGDLSSVGEHPGTYDTTLRRILGNLAEELGSPLLRADGEALVTQRPAGGWVSFPQIQSLALGGAAPKLEVFRPYLALNAWVDRKVIRPTALPALVGVSPKAWAELKRGSSDDPVGTGNFFTGGRSAPSPQFEPRAPVSLPWARRHKAALAALIRDLEGVYLDESSANSFTYGDVLGRTRSVKLNAAEAGQVADLLATSTSELSTWQQWNEYCDTLGSDILVLTGTTDAVELQAKRDLLKANFNPNSDLNKFNPNPSLWKEIDKSDLLAYSTEFSLYEPHGYGISSAGRILSAGGRLLASRTLQAEVSGPMALRLTTQKEFVCNNLGSLEVAGDESDLRQPGWKVAGAPEYITQSNGLSRTWGHRLNTSGGYPGGWMNGNSQGLSLQTYPEPCVQAGIPFRLSTAPASYDGNLQLATVETANDDMYTVTATTTHDMKCLARFNDDLSLDVHDCTTATSAQNQADICQAPSLTNSLLDAAFPNTLYPDGCYAERNRAPGYLDRDNCNGFHGVLSFWVKPNYDILAATWSRGRQYFRWTNYGVSNQTQFFFLGNTDYGNPKNSFVAQFETWHTDDDPCQEHAFQIGNRPIEPRRWYLMTLFWDFQEPGLNADNVGELVVDGGVLPENLASYNTYSSWNNASVAEDITVDAQEDASGGPFKPHKFFLGKRGACGGNSFDSWLNGVAGTGADATFDELALYDFGQVPTSANQLAASRYPEGRYTKGWQYSSLSSPPAPDQAGSWFSAPIPLPNGSVLRDVRWTWYRPPSLPQDYPEIELTATAGASYLWAESLSRSTMGSGWTVDRQSWKVNEALPGPFRAHVVFRRPAALSLSTPILDSPVLDDLTFLYEPPGGPRITSWEEAE